MRTTNRTVELLSALPLFAHCTRRELHDIGLHADEIWFHSGTELAHEGHPLSSEALLVIEGAVRSDGQHHGPGALLGLEETLLGRPVGATLVAEGPVKALCLDYRGCVAVRRATLVHHSRHSRPARRRHTRAGSMFWLWRKTFAGS